MTGYLSKIVLRHIDRILYKITLQKRRFVKWAPSSPDVNPLDYFFWDLVKTKVFQGRPGESFSSGEELKTKITAVWKDCLTDLF